MSPFISVQTTIPEPPPALPPASDTSLTDNQIIENEIIDMF
jgi:hypothetical protein